LQRNSWAKPSFSGQWSHKKKFPHAQSIEKSFCPSKFNSVPQIGFKPVTIFRKSHFEGLNDVDDILSWKGRKQSVKKSRLSVTGLLKRQVLNIV
jgi:hypothetical protein